MYRENEILHPFDICPVVTRISINCMANTVTGSTFVFTGDICGIYYKYGEITANGQHYRVYSVASTKHTCYPSMSFIFIMFHIKDSKLGND